MENCENLVNKLEYIPVECICVLSNDELIWKKSAGKKRIVGDITNKLTNINLDNYLKDNKIKIPKDKWDISVKLTINSFFYHNNSIYKLAILKDNKYFFIDRNIDLIKKCIEKFKNSSSNTAKLTHTPTSYTSSYVAPSSSLSFKKKSSSSDNKAGIIPPNLSPAKQNLSPMGANQNLI